MSVGHEAAGDRLDCALVRGERRRRSEALKGIDRSKLGTVIRRGGARQVTYTGHPLYYYLGDTKPGQILCQNVREYGGLWLVIAPSGKLVR